ncbi:MAG: DUF4325 domain-containing protein [Deltaproteobacteria bacterium]|nr:DUF4325 domain-containing protein [Deltaproteobacteria bacterium]
MVDDFDGRITRFLSVHGAATSTEVAKLLGVSRQSAHGRLRKLVAAGAVVVDGAGRATRYRLAERAWERRFSIDGLEEDRVYEALSSGLPDVGALEGESASVVSYVVTEMVNNAIDHSGGHEVRVAARAARTHLFLEVEDDGVGAFAHVRDELNLDSELSAIQEISKGKTTTAPDRHSGEGIFFVSKVVDVFRIESGTLAWVVYNERDDVAVEALPRPRAGTRVTVELDTARVRSLTDIFALYTEDYAFTKTRTVIKLFTIGVRFMSRSEAKRLLHGLEKFREVVLDFSGVDAVGQGFADEVFRIWANAHPEVVLGPTHMNEAVAFMVNRARGGV